MVVKQVWLATLVAVVALGVAAHDAQAFWGSRGSWGSSGGSWGSRGSWGSYGGRWGSRGSYGSWGSRGSYGSYGSWGSHGGYAGSYRSYGSYGSYGGVYTYGGETVVYGPVASSESSRASSQTAAAAPKTRLTLHVPADAKVTLAGAATKQRGRERTFSTTKLAAGQTWDGYQVVVELQRAGQVYSQQRTITLTGGQSQELSIDFPASQLAQLTR